MKKIAILGATGMLGSMLVRVLKDDFQLLLVYKDQQKIDYLEKTHGSINLHTKIPFDLRLIYNDFVKGFSQKNSNLTSLIKKIGKIDLIINSAGIIKPFSLLEPEFTFFLNSALPQLLSDIFEEKLVHISTDCVFDGHKGAPYTELAQISANDLYGLTKCLGEPKDKSLVFRTSIIGPELLTSNNLLEWFKSQNGKSVKGFKNHLWNGITTKEFAKIIKKIAQSPRRYPQKGLFHIFSSTVSKYEMLLKFREKYKLNITIQKEDTKPGIDRRLTSVYSLNANLKILDFDQMLAEL